MRTISLITCNNIQEANLIKGRLANEGIFSIVTNENMTTLLPNYNGMFNAGSQVLVHEVDYDKASEILKINSYQESQEICPNCQSRNIKFSLGTKKFRKIIAILFSLILFIPFGNINNTYHCQDCNSDFSI